MSQLFLPEKHYSQKIAREVIDICKPLEEIGIVYFCYARFFNDGSCYVLTNQWDSIFNHCKKKFPITPPVPENLKGKKFHYLPYLISTTHAASELYRKVFNEYRSLFNLGHPIYFIEDDIDYMDMYAYCTLYRAHHLEDINFYLSHIDIFEKFKLYFKDKARKLISHSNKNKIIIPPSMSSGFYHHQASESSDKKHLLTQLTPKHYRLSANVSASISTREFDVLKELSTGATIKEVALSMDLSPRTVESYLKNVKNKLGLQKKSDIIKILIASHLL